MNNPMFGGLGGLGPPPQLSPQLTPNPMAKTQSNSPHLNASPPNLFVPSNLCPNPPPPNLPGMGGMPGGLPNMNMTQSPCFNPPRTTYPSPPVSTLIIRYFLPCFAIFIAQKLQRNLNQIGRCN
eukprot:183080_1